MTIAPTRGFVIKRPTRQCILCGSLEHNEPEFYVADVVAWMCPTCKKALLEVVKNRKKECEAE